jgi:CRP/FNR family transcriptional regulator, cyclic AMP receptor protein
VKTAKQPVSIPPLLSGLDEAQRHAVLARAAPRAYPPGAVLCRQGEAAESLFLVRSGRVRFARTTGDGRDVLLRALNAGDCFGLASLVPGPVNYMATAVANGEASLLVWGGSEVREAAVLFPRLSENAFRIALDYLQQIIDRHVALLSTSAEQRVARTITRLGATNGRVLPTGVEVEISNHDLAALADVGMFTVSRQLKRWEREGHLLKTRQKVLLRHPEALITE